MQIQWVHPEVFADELRSAVEQRLAALAAGHDDLIDVRITANTTPHHKHGAQEVRIVCEARGRQLVAARERLEAALALDEALDAFERELRELRRQRNDPRRRAPAAPPELGIVDRVFRDEGYGFILTDSGEQVYFHRNALHGGLAFEALAEGQRVGLNVEPGEQGVQATVVRPAPPGAPAP
jgi:cold shock CspA family protein/ribosome-associated translation inhibitor RaiA